jgi:hypothetical protein
MTQADSVHSTPPTSTSANNSGRSARPAGATITPGLAQQQRERDKAIRRLFKLREKASAEIERLLEFLDASDSYVATELEAAIDDGPCDTDELEIEDGNDEPSLGSSGHGEAGAISYLFHAISDGSDMILDCEGDEHDGREPDADGEPSLCGLTSDRRDHANAMKVV